MNDKCCGISKHIRPEEDADVLFDNEVGGNPAWGRKRMITLIPPMHYLTKSWCLDIVEDGRDQETRC